jgi:hypothetical protein
MSWLVDAGSSVAASFEAYVRTTWASPEFDFRFARNTGTILQFLT